MEPIAVVVLVLYGLGIAKASGSNGPRVTHPRTKHRPPPTAPDTEDAVIIVPAEEMGRALIEAANRDTKALANADTAGSTDG